MSKVTIYSIVTNEILSPGIAFNYLSHQNEMIFVEALDSLKFLHKNVVIELNPRECLIAQNFSIQNPSQFFLKIRLIKLRIENFSLALNFPILFDANQRNLTFIREVFSVGQINSTILNKAEVYLSSFLTNRESSPNINHSSKKIDLRLILVNRYLRENLDKAITSRQLADIVECNQVYLCNTYSKVFKISPIKHFQVMKMKKAKEMLAATTSNIREISRKLGYISPSQFSNYFKRYYGVTPLEFRKNSRKE